MKAIWDFLDGYKTYLFGLVIMGGGVGLCFVPGLGPSVGVTLIGVGGSVIGGAHKAQKLTDAINAVGADQKQAVIDAVLATAKAELQKSNTLPPEAVKKLEQAAQEVARKVVAPAVLLALFAFGASGCAAAKQYRAGHDDECLVGCAVTGGIECKNQYDETKDGQLLAQCITLKGIACSDRCRTDPPATGTIP